MAEKNPPYPPVPDDRAGWPVNQDRVSPGGDDLSYEEGLPTLLELVPRKGQPLGMLLTGIAAVALLMAGYRGFGASRPAWVPIPLSAFALEGPGNLASWFSSLVLTAAGLYALVIWWMLHWLYRQRSGIWLLAAICWFFMGINESSGLHLALARLLGEFSGSSTNSPLWWLIPYGLVFAGIVSRLVVDLKQSWGALLWMTLAMGAYLLSVIVQAGVNVASPLGWEPVMAEELGELVGHWFLLMANVSFAAYLVRDILGDDPGGMAETTEGQRAVAAGTETLGRSRGRSVGDPPIVEEPAENRGDVLIIHPPHGYGPPRAVRRIVRPGKRTASATKTSRRRSDLDLPTRRMSHKPTVSSLSSAIPPCATANVRPQPAVKEQSPSETSNCSAAMNAFLAGMAYAEAQKAAQSAAVASPSSSPLTTELPQAGAMSTMVNPASRAGDVYTAQPTARNLEYTDQPGRVGVANPYPSSALLQATFSNTGQTAATRYVGGSGQGHSASSGNASGQAPAVTGQPAIQLPARKLTKEEKKRLKQLYKQRLAQQA